MNRVSTPKFKDEYNKDVFFSLDLLILKKLEDIPELLSLDMTIYPVDGSKTWRKDWPLIVRLECMVASKMYSRRC